jgi:hypothetical protein
LGYELRHLILQIMFAARDDRGMTIKGQQG